MQTAITLGARGNAGPFLFGSTDDHAQRDMVFRGAVRPARSPNRLLQELNRIRCAGTFSGLERSDN